MAVKISSSISCVSTSFSSPFRTRRSPQVRLPSGSQDCRQHSSTTKPKFGRVHRCCLRHGKSETFRRKRFMLFASVGDLISSSEVEPEGTEEGDYVFPSDKCEPVGKSGGRPGLITFYSRSYKREPEILLPIIIPTTNHKNLLWFVGPAVLVASFIFPSVYMRRILSTVFEDSLLTDFLILFFTEAFFYSGVAMFLLIVDNLRRPSEPYDGRKNRDPAPQIVYRITSVAVLVLSLVIPMVTMGLVWPWTGPAASATLAPYLVGIVVQFAFEQYARYVNSPAWPVIPVIFQIYRLHQLNRAAQLVTALSLTVRGAEATPHNLAINGSLGTLMNVLQGLGVICIWSLSSFLMRFLPSATITDQ